MTKSIEILTMREREKLLLAQNIGWDKFKATVIECNKPIRDSPDRTLLRIACLTKKKPNFDLQEAGRYMYVNFGQFLFYRRDPIGYMWGKQVVLWTFVMSLLGLRST